MRILNEKPDYTLFVNNRMEFGFDVITIEDSLQEINLKLRRSDAENLIKALQKCLIECKSKTPLYNNNEDFMES